MSEDQKAALREAATQQDALESVMDPIPVPEMGIPVDGKQSKKFPDSTNVFCVEYDFPEKVLTVEFANGGIYEYREVPVEVWRNIQRADSAGKVIAAEVRGKFTSVKVQPWPVPGEADDFPEL